MCFFLLVSIEYFQVMLKISPKNKNILVLYILSTNTISNPNSNNSNIVDLFSLYLFNFLIFIKYDILNYTYILTRMQ